MNLLSRRSVLAIAAVVDVALHSRSAPVAAKALAARHKLPPRHLETLLQGLVHAKTSRACAGRGAVMNWRASGGALRLAKSCAPRCAEHRRSRGSGLKLGIARARDRSGGAEGGRNLSRQSGCDHRRTDVRDGRESRMARRREGQRRFCYLIPVFARLAPAARATWIASTPAVKSRRCSSRRGAGSLRPSRPNCDRARSAAARSGLGTSGFIDPGSQRVIGTSCLLAR